MIKNIEISGIHYDVDDKLKKYVLSKIGRLDRYMPRKSRRPARAEVKLSETKGKKNEKYTAEVILHLPNGQLTASESTLNMYAAVDIVEAKLRNQLRKLKEKHLTHRKIDRKGILRRVSRMANRDYWGGQN
ncbi:MAG TPA: ribosome-associated translation inhibitor RaiA [Candidatus Saccharimonadales bacterium]|jgi:putative sigma-54 modulation protein